MMDKNRYVVDIDAMVVRDVLIDDGIEYEVIATHDEVKQIEKLFNEMKDDNVESLKYLLLPFNEKKVDDERESYNEHLISIYRMVRDLGTEQTKIDIESLRIFK